MRPHEPHFISLDSGEFRMVSVGDILCPVESAVEPVESSMEPVIMPVQSVVEIVPTVESAVCASSG
jgi:hypothetical protein